jgi:hypothetical protein
MFRLWLPKYQKVSKMFNLTKNANNNPATCHFSIKKIINLKTKKKKKKKKLKKKTKFIFLLVIYFIFKKN